MKALRALAITVVLSPAVASATSPPSASSIRFVPCKSRFLVGEPVAGVIEIRNAESAPLTVDLGVQLTGVELLIKPPRGPIEKIRPVWSGGINVGGDVSVGPLETVARPFVLGEYLETTETGTYEVEVRPWAPADRRLPLKEASTFEVVHGDAEALAQTIASVAEVAMQPGDMELRDAAARTLAAYRAEAAIPYLDRLAKVRVWSLQQAAISGLGKIRSEDAVRALLSNYEQLGLLKAAAAIELQGSLQWLTDLDLKGEVQRILREAGAQSE